MALNLIDDNEFTLIQQEFLQIKRFMIFMEFGHFKILQAMDFYQALPHPTELKMRPFLKIWYKIELTIIHQSMVKTLEVNPRI